MGKERDFEELEYFREIAKSRRVTPTNWDNMWYSKDNQTQVGMEKLWRLENIEEELGCPLEVLFNALINKEIYFVTDKLECSKNLNCYISLDTNTCLANEMCIDICIDEPKKCREENVYLYLKDYKKTWWLKDRSE